MSDNETVFKDLSEQLDNEERKKLFDQVSEISDQAYSPKGSKRTMGKDENEDQDKKFQRQLNRDYSRLNLSSKIKMWILSRIKKISPKEAYLLTLLEKLKEELNSREKIVTSTSVTPILPLLLHSVYNDTESLQIVLDSFFKEEDLFAEFIKNKIKSLDMNTDVKNLPSDFISRELLLSQMKAGKSEEEISREYNKQVIGFIRKSGGQKVVREIKKSIMPFHFANQLFKFSYPSFFVLFGGRNSPSENPTFRSCRTDSAVSFIQKLMQLAFSLEKINFDKDDIEIFFSSYIAKRRANLSPELRKKNQNKYMAMLKKTIASWRRLTSIVNFSNLYRYCMKNIYLETTHRNLPPKNITPEIILNHYKNYLVNSFYQFYHENEEYIIKEFEKDYPITNSFEFYKMPQGGMFKMFDIPSFKHTGSIAFIQFGIKNYYENDLKNMFRFIIKNVIPKGTEFFTKVATAFTKYHSSLQMIETIDRELSPEKEMGMRYEESLRRLKEFPEGEEETKKYREVVEQIDKEAAQGVKAFALSLEKVSFAFTETLKSTSEEIKLHLSMIAPSINKERLLSAVLEDEINEIGKIIKIIRWKFNNESDEAIL